MTARILVTLVSALLILLAPTVHARFGQAPPLHDPAPGAPTPTAGEDAAIAPADLLNPDGTLNLNGGVSGALDLDGWRVTLDPQRGPVLTPQADHATSAEVSAPQSASGAWVHLGEVPGALDGAVLDVAVSGGSVYVGGGFAFIGGNPALSHIARWDGAQWHPLGGGLNDWVFALAVSGSDVYVGGAFTDAGGNVNADYIARWDGAQWRPSAAG
ncbi:MAG: hypothetical protein RMJ48_04045 [Roseiflexaceae bacterium]|nr:hypothetical protein [Roseiflexaceae bacterium]